MKFLIFSSVIIFSFAQTCHGIAESTETVSSTGSHADISWSNRGENYTSEILPMTETVYDTVQVLNKKADVPGGRSFQCQAKLGKLTSDGIQVFSLEKCTAQ